MQLELGAKSYWQGNPPDRCSICQKALLRCFVETDIEIHEPITGKRHVFEKFICCVGCSLNHGVGDKRIFKTSTLELVNG